MTKMNILAIGAHPDDIEFGCGGTRLYHQFFNLIMHPMSSQQLSESFLQWLSEY